MEQKLLIKCLKTFKIYKDLKKQLFEENKSCSICNNTNNLIIHFIIPLEELLNYHDILHPYTVKNLNLIFDPDNCLVLCKECSNKLGAEDETR